MLWTLAFRAATKEGETALRNTPVDIQLSATGSRAKVLFVNITTVIPLPPKALIRWETSPPDPLRWSGAILRVSTEPETLSVIIALIFRCPIALTPELNRG